MKTTEKILPLQLLPERIQAEKAEGRKVVHCHGVFDLMHIGHIRHFAEAKSVGDVLVVTVTPDRYVNKGPNRPVFTETLRAEAIASLDCVDYVAVNEWPMAVETIKLLKPDFFVKGSEFRGGKDRTGAITVEQEAVESVGGKLHLTDDITFSSSTLINKYLDVLPPHLVSYLEDFASRHQMADIVDVLDSARKLKVLVVGETILDRYVYCQAIGKSSKEPTLVAKRLDEEIFAGGILAIANHIAAFSGVTGMVSQLGGADSREEFIRSKLVEGVSPHFVYRENAPTIIKTRYVEHYFLTKMLEIYDINDHMPTQSDVDRLCAELEKHLGEYDLVVVADYGHAMMTPEVIKVLCEKSNYLAVNAQSNAGNLGYHAISKYPRADFVCITENEMRMEARNKHGDLKDMIREVADQLNCSQVVVTRGSNGCIGFDREEGYVEVPAFATKVVDRIGAGDAFLSLSSLSAALKSPLELTLFIGNAAGSQAVTYQGNKQFIERTPLIRQIECLLK